MVYMQLISITGSAVDLATVTDLQHPLPNAVSLGDRNGRCYSPLFNH